MPPTFDPALGLILTEVVNASGVLAVVTFIAGLVAGFGWSFVDRFAERCADNHYRALRERQQRATEAIPGLEVREHD